MVKMYELIYLGKNIGSVRMEKAGLYYNIDCRCRLETPGIYHIVAVSNSTEVDLGVCVPITSEFGIETRIPVKKLGEGQLTFRIEPKECQKQESIIPIQENAPFKHIAHLDQARLVFRNGKPGLLLQNTENQNWSGKDISSPTGQ